MMHDYDQRREFDPPQPEPPTYFWWIFVLVIFGVLLLTIGIARGDQPPRRPHQITLLFFGNAYDQVARTHMVLGNITYESREDCMVSIVRVRVMISGARLRCDPVEEARTQ